MYSECSPDKWSCARNGIQNKIFAKSSMWIIKIEIFIPYRLGPTLAMTTFSAADQKSEEWR